MHNISDSQTSPTCSVASQSKRVMLVDDDPVFRNITSACLAAQGYEVIEAGDGLEGLKVLRDHEPDIVICDLAMPVLNGVEFVEEVSSAYPSLPMIVVSATESISDVARVVKCGIKDFLTKPISNPSNLIEAIENTLEDADTHVGDNRDFSSQWFRVDSSELPEEQELHWHLDYLEQNPSAAKDFLLALLPEKDTSLGNWKCSYRLLQSTDVMPVVFDYAWLMSGQFVFYLIDSGSSEKGAATTLLVRALFHDYIRGLKAHSANIKELARIVEKGMECIECAAPVDALFGVVNLTEGTITVLPAGLGMRVSDTSVGSIQLQAGKRLGEQCSRNRTISDASFDHKCHLNMSLLGVSSFTLDIVNTSQD